MSQAMNLSQQPMGPVYHSGITCERPGHIHHWPTQGQLMIERCEHYCLFCTGAKAHKRWSSAWFLRRHIRTAHVANEYPALEIGAGWEKRPDGNTRPLFKKRPPPGANRKRNRLPPPQSSPPTSAGITAAFVNSMPHINLPFDFNADRIIHTQTFDAHAYDRPDANMAFTGFDDLINYSSTSLTFDFSLQQSVVDSSDPHQEHDTSYTTTQDTNNPVFRSSLVNTQHELPIEDRLAFSPAPELHNAAFFSEVSSALESQVYDFELEAASQETFISPQATQFVADTPIPEFEPETNFNVMLDIDNFLGADQLGTDVAYNQFYDLFTDSSALSFDAQDLSDPAEQAMPAKQW